MFRAGRKANELGHPVLLDPVGAGASALRTDTAAGAHAGTEAERDSAEIFSEIKTLAKRERPLRKAWTRMRPML